MTYGGETERVNFYTKSSDVLLLKFSRQVSLDERGLRVMSADAGRLRSRTEKVKGILLVASASRRLLWTGSGMPHLSCSAITNKHKLEAGRSLGSLRHFLNASWYYLRSRRVGCTNEVGCFGGHRESSRWKGDVGCIRQKGRVYDVDHRGCSPCQAKIYAKAGATNWRANIIGHVS